MKWDFEQLKKRFKKATSDSRYRHKKINTKWLEAQGFSADDYNDSESVEILDLAKLWCRAMGACEWCGKKLSATESEPDHLIPLSKGGSNNHTNIVLCCSKCNGRKATKHPACFAAEQKAQGISTPLIETYLKRYKNNPGVQQILSADFGLL